MKKEVQFYIVSVGVLLFLIGFIKLIGSFASSRVFLTSDPIFGILYRDTLRIVGAFEVGIALVCILGRHIGLQIGLVAWLATNFVLYRLGLVLIGYHKPCSCLGNLTDALHISPQVADNIMKVVLAYLLIGSYGLLFRQWKQRRAAARSGSAKNATS